MEQSQPTNVTDLAPLSPRKPVVRRDANAVLTAPEKAAIIISLLGPDSARPIVEQIDDHHLRSFMSALENLQQIPREKMLAVVADFITEMQARRGSFRGGPDAAKGLLENIFEEDRVTKLFGAPPPPPKPPTTAENIWQQLKDYDTAQLAAYLETKKIVVISTVLSQLATEKTGEVLAELSEDISVECVAMMSRDASLDPRTIDAVAELVNMELLTSETKDSGSEAASFVADVLGILPRDRRNKMLAALEAKDPEQAKRIRAGMLTFEDLKTRLPVSAIPVIFRDFDKTQLLRMLKAGPDQDEATIEYFYANISQRMAGQFKEQVDELGPITQKQGESAMSALMSFIRSLEGDGTVKLNPKEKPANA